MRRRRRAERRRAEEEKSREVAKPSQNHTQPYQKPEQKPYQSHTRRDKGCEVLKMLKMYHELHVDLS